MSSLFSLSVYLSALRLIYSSCFSAVDQAKVTGSASVGAAAPSDCNARDSAGHFLSGRHWLISR